MNPYLSLPTEIVERRYEGVNIYTLRLRFCETTHYSFLPGQFNMLYLFGAGEVPISIASDPSNLDQLDHTIRAVGGISRGIVNLQVGDTVGLRGPYGSCWPMVEAEGKDLLFITGGLGCAPVTGAIEYVMHRRQDYGAVKILHGVKQPSDLIYHEKLKSWRTAPNTEVLLTSDVGQLDWKHNVGVVTDLLQQVEINPERSIVMMCGPEMMMRFAVKGLIKKNLSPNRIYLSLERNMQCALGFCGHCQYGPHFICRDGPVLRYDQIEDFFDKKEI